MDAGYFSQASLTILFIFLQCFTHRVSSVSVSANSPLRGSTAELVCSFSSMGQYLVAKWEREVGDDGEDIQIARYSFKERISHYNDLDDGGRYTLTYREGSQKSTAILEIADVSLDDIGTYKCELFGASTPSATVQLEVLVPPDEIGIVDSRTNVEVPDGGPLRVTAGQATLITCLTHFSGTRPATELVWRAQADAVETSSVTAVVETPMEPRLEQTTSRMNFTTTLEAHGKWLECQGNHDGLATPLRSRLTLDVDVAPTEILLKKSLIAYYTEGEEVALIQGSKFSISCTVPGTKPAVEIDWLLDDQPLATLSSQSTVEMRENPTNPLLEDTTSSLVIADPGRELHGKLLKCVGTGADGIRVTGSISLIVQGPPDNPEIVEEPMSIEDGELVTFSCSAHNGYPAPSLRWLLDGQLDLTSNASHGQFDSGGQRFTTSSVITLYPTKEMNGKRLSCVVPEYEDLTDSTTLDVQYCPGPFDFTLCPSVLDNDVASVTCSVGPSNPAVGLSLSLNGDGLDMDAIVEKNSDQGYPGMVTRLYYTSPAVYRENGPFTYSCCATRQREGCPRLPCANCTLDIQYEPIISSISLSPLSNIRIGAQVEITCNAEANPLTADTVRWEIQRPGSPDWIAYNGTAGVWDGANQWQLVLRDIQIGDAGGYRCVANNGIRQAVRSDPVKVTIVYVPIIDDSVPTLVRTREGREKALVCRAWGNPAPSITWYNATRSRMETDPGKHVVSESVEAENSFNGSLVNGELNFFYVRREKHFGFYYCNATNFYGTTLLKIVLNGTSVPETPTSLREVTRLTSSSSLSFLWSPGEDGGETQYFDVSFCPVLRPAGCKDLRLTVANYTAVSLTPYTKYRIVVYSHNAVGYSSQSLSREGITLPLSPAKEGLDITYNSASGEVAIAQNPKGSYNIEELPCIRVEIRRSTDSAWEEQLLPCLMEDAKVTIPKDLPQSSIRVKSCIPDTQMCSGVEAIALAVISEEASSKLIIIIIIAAASVCLLVCLFVCVVFLLSRRRPHTNIHNREHLEMKNRPDGYKSFSKDYDNNTANRGEKEAFLPPVYTERHSVYEPITVVDPKSPNPYHVHQQPNGHGVPVDRSTPTANNPNGLIYAEIGHKVMHPSDQPPIRTGEQTDYAELDLQRMEELKENRKNEQSLQNREPLKIYPENGGTVCV